MNKILGVLVLGLVLCGLTRAGEEGARRRPPPGMIVKFALGHAEQLSLTAEQKTKLEELAKKGPGEGGERREKPPEGAGGERGERGGPLAQILTKEQMEKLRELMKAERPEGGGDRERKPKGDK